MPSDLATAPPLSELVAQADDVPQPAAWHVRQPGNGTCLSCGLAGPCYLVDGTHGVFSAAFTSSDALGQGDGICYRCRYLAGAMDYRRYHWVATPDEVRVIKERPDLIDVLLDPPEGPWMAQYKDGSDFLTVLNGWLYAQRVNTSRERYRLLVDKDLVDIERERFAEMIAFGRDLRARENEPSKRALKGPVTAADLSRYDLDHDEARRINNDLAGREDWRIAVQLID